MSATSHDPKRVIELMRDHLAAHDKRLVFLFGAGTSCGIDLAPPAPAGERRAFEPLVPAIGLMTQRCKEAVERLSDEHGRAWASLVAECEQLHLDPNIETLLGRIRLKMEATGPSESVFGLDRDALAAVESTIREAIVAMASPGEDVIPPSIPHDRLATWIRQARRRHAIEIFTTNYDVLVERSLDRARVPVFDGFVGSFEPHFSPDTFTTEASMPGPDWARVWKLHGSVNWETRASVAIRRSDAGSGEMILPSHRKYDESRKQPYIALMDRLATTLSHEGTLLLTCGYSWNDDHINDVIRSSLDAHPANHAIALMYPPLAQVPKVVTLAAGRPNLMVIGPTEGILRRVRAPWMLTQEPSAAVASHIDIAFDADGRPESDAGPIGGEMRLGDFGVMCRFLELMVAEAEW